PGLLHHKYAILDQGTLTTDPRVATGSHNWTASAETVNDENTLIIHDARVANLFFQEWSARHSDVAAIGEEAPAEALAAWPIPADRLLHLRPSGLGPALITVHDATGREVYRMETNGLATICTGDWPAGVYVVSAVQDGMRSQRTVAVVR
ncbi:MAG: T9SS type A sorting domain-containing protein, partial [Flavobacteriales bacterium]|nr:T9SS type A sorting domain-containing protein [Flavobacteriales bacterium]